MSSTFPAPIVHLTWRKFDLAVGVLAGAIAERDRSGALAGVYGVPKGGIILAVALAHRLSLPLLLAPPVNAVPFVWCDDLVSSGWTFGLDADRPGVIPVCWATKRPDLPVLHAAVFRPEAWLVFPWEDTARSLADRTAYLARGSR